MSSAIHVAMLIQRYAPLIGGAERQIGDLSEKLVQSGLRVSVLTRRYSGLPAFEVINGVSVYRLPVPGPKLTASLAYTFSALPLLARLRPDVLHAHEMFSPATTAVTAKRLFGTPIALTIHRSGPEWGEFARLQRKFMGASRLQTFKRMVDCFVSISESITEEMVDAGIPAAQRCAIPNGVDTERFRPLDASARDRIRQELGLIGGPIAIFTGRLAPEKRVDQLVEAWKSVRAAHPDATLLVLGTGEERDALQLMAGDGVIFTGPQENVVPYLQAADLFVLPSVAEGLSVAMLEAMSCGLPALLTRVGAAPEVIRHGENGCLVNPDSPAELTSALLLLLADSGLRSKIGAQARITVEESYSLVAVVRQFVDLYQRLSGMET